VEQLQPWQVRSDGSDSVAVIDTESSACCSCGQVSEGGDEDDEVDDQSGSFPLELVLRFATCAELVELDVEMR
jgi:hypothetical protein